MKVLLVTACGCTRILENYYGDLRELEVALPAVNEPMDYLWPKEGTPLPPPLPGIQRRQFSWSPDHEIIRCGKDEMRVLREVVNKP